MEGVIFKGPIEPGSVVRSQGEALPQSIHQIRVTGKVTTVKEAIIFSRFHNAPGVGVIKSSGGEERCGTEDLPETIQSDILQAPVLKETIFLAFTKDLLIALEKSVNGYQNQTSTGNVIPVQ